MSGLVEGIDRSQNSLFPAELEDYVAEVNPVRAVEAFVDGLVVRLLMPVHHRLRLLAFPMRTAVLCERHTTPAARHETSQVPIRSFCK